MLVFLRQAWRTPQPLQRELDQKPDFIMSLLVEVGSTHVKYAIWPWPKSFFVKSYVFQNVLAKECQIGQNRTAKIKKGTSKSLIWFRKFIFSEQENKWFFKAKMGIQSHRLMSGLLMRMLGSRCHRTDCPTCFVERRWKKCLVCISSCSSGFPSTRTNLSPFTKDFRGGEQFEWVYRLIFRRPALRRGTWIKRSQKLYSCRVVVVNSQWGNTNWWLVIKITVRRAGSSFIFPFPAAFFPQEEPILQATFADFDEWIFIQCSHFRPGPKFWSIAKNKFTFSPRYWVLNWCVFPL